MKQALFYRLQMKTTNTACQLNNRTHVSYDVSGRWVTDGILGCQRDRAQHDEDEDEVGEDLMIDQSMTQHTNPALHTEVRGHSEDGQIYIDWQRRERCEAYGLELLKMKKALPSGMGDVFSLRLRSESLWGRGPDGISGSPSSSSPTNTHASEHWSSCDRLRVE